MVPLLHPAAILRGRWNDEPAQVTYLQRWAAIAKSNPSYLPDDINQLPPRSTIFPSVAQFESFARELRQLREPCLSVDIENAGIFILCIGLTQLDLASGNVGSTINLPIRLRGGRQAWPKPVLEKLIVILDDMLSDKNIAILTHNGTTYDIPMLEKLGFTVRGPLYDTMVLAHLGYPEMRKGLQFCATLYLGAGVWKTLVDTLDDLEDKS